MGKYAYFEHDADIGIEGTGKTVEEAFESAAAALFAIQSDLSEIAPKQKIVFYFAESDEEFAFVMWLNRLIYEGKNAGLAFCSFKLERRDNLWHGEAEGEPWSEKMTRGVEVKGATLTCLSVKKKNDIWEARCIVDV
ncbi:MAG TPA: archease [Burkholderiales bacterium]|nr:archease [Burkholderiales bacterium]